MFSIFFLILTIELIFPYSILTSKLVLDSEGNLQNLLVFIKDDVVEDDGTLIQNIKTYFTEASRSLFQATQNVDPTKSGVQFEFIYIRVPKTWKIRLTSQATWQQCNNADIFITTNRENNYKNEPYTKQIGSCGESGEFTRYPSDFFSSKKADIMSKGKTIMTEFAKQRYGVFSEKPFQNLLTVFDGTKFLQSTCGESIKWTLSKPPAFCSIANNDCRYYINRGQTHLSSVMFDQETPSSSFFCDNNFHNHNKFAKSLHNLKCDGRSVTEVILDHSDFKANRTKTQFSPPFFILVKGDYRNIVLTIDTSGSMEEKLKSVKNAAIEFINNVVEDTAKVGLVSFNTTARIVSNLMSMNMKSNKEILVKRIHSLTADDSTNIPDGIRKAIMVLGGNIDDLEEIRGTIILLTDGRNNEEIITWDLLIPVQLEYKKVIVHTISYGPESDTNLVKIANKTGGRYMFANPSDSYPDLMSKFAMKTFCENSETSSVKVQQGIAQYTLDSNVQIFNLVHIDPYVGKNIYLALTFDSNIYNYNISLISPKDLEFTVEKLTKDKNNTILTFKIPGKAEVGYYKLKISILNKTPKFKRSLAFSSISLTYVLSSILEASSSRVIMPTGKLSTSEIFKPHNFTSVVATVDMSTCNLSPAEIVSVTLIMTDPTNNKLKRTMYDNGLGNDSVEKDAVYSTTIYAKDLNIKGFFTFSADITIFNKDINDFIKRTVDFDALLVKDKSDEPLVDKIPPARINNLNLNILDKISKKLRLTFTATGNDGVVGNISLYQIQIGDARVFQLNLTEEAYSLLPLSTNLTLNMTSYDKPFKISIRGVDPEGNEGQWSPEQIFSWEYDDIWDKYSKVGSKNKLKVSTFGLNILFIFVFLNRSLKSANSFNC